MTEHTQEAERRPAHPAVAACPIGKCGYVAIRDTVDEAREAERRHWARNHEPKEDER